MRTRVIATIAVAAVIAFVLIAPGSARAQDLAALQRKVDAAATLLAQRGYIRYDGDTTTKASKLAPGSPGIMRLLDRALESYDYGAAHAIALLNKYGGQGDWVGADEDGTVEDRADGPSAAASTDDGLDPRLSHILEQVYGEKGEGYGRDTLARARTDLNHDMIETYRVGAIQEEGDDWYALTVEVGGTLSRPGSPVHVRVNTATGQVVQFVGSDGATTVERQVTPLD